MTFRIPNLWLRDNESYALSQTLQAMDFDYLFEKTYIVVFGYQTFNFRF